MLVVAMVISFPPDSLLCRQLFSDANICFHTSRQLVRHSLAGKLALCADRLDLYLLSSRVVGVTIVKLVVQKTNQNKNTQSGVSSPALYFQCKLGYQLDIDYDFLCIVTFLVA